MFELPIKFIIIKFYFFTLPWWAAAAPAAPAPRCQSAAAAAAAAAPGCWWGGQSLPGSTRTGVKGVARHSPDLQVVSDIAQFKNILIN